MPRAAGSLNRPLIAIALALSLACAACGEPVEVLVSEGLLVLEGATLIDGTGTEPREDSVIVVDGDRILRVGGTGEFHYPDSTHRKDVSGLFVLPGFIDMHVHVHPEARIETVEALLEFGVTTIRSPGAAQSAGVELRDQIKAGQVRGPRMITGAAFINGSPRFDWTVAVATPDEIRDVVRQQAAADADMIKLYWDVTPDLVAAAIEEAHALGLKVVGHLHATSWTQAARLGIDALLHSGAEGPTWELVPERHRAQLRALPYREFYARWIELVELDGELMNSLIAALVANNVTVDPTLVAMESLHFGDDPKVLAPDGGSRLSLSREAMCPTLFRYCRETVDSRTQATKLASGHDSMVYGSVSSS